MNKICKLSAIALLASSTSLMAQTKSFEGASVGVFAGAFGVEAKGTANTTAGTGGGGEAASSGSGQTGAVSGIGGIDLSYGFGAGSGTVIGIGATYVPAKAKVTTGSSNDTSAGGAINVELKNHYTVYIQPTFVLNKDSAAFVKVNYAAADLSASGQNVRITSGDISGWGAGVGLKTFLTPNAFIQVEANYTDYDSITATKTNTGTGRITTATGDPKVAQGLVTLGYKF